MDVPVDMIAEKAGVGVGTFYRHFPTKEKLCEAILLERLAGITEDARALAEAEDPAAAFFGFLDHVVREGASKRDLVVAVTGAALEFEMAARRGEGGAARGDGHAAAPGPGGGGRALRRHSGHGDVPWSVRPAKRPSTWARRPSCDLLAIVCDGLRPQGGG